MNENYNLLRVQMLDTYDGYEIWETVYEHKPSGVLVSDPEKFEIWLKGMLG